MNKGNLTLLGAVIISLMITCMAAHAAGIVNPDPFERYTPTTNWQPSAVVDGWSRAPWSDAGMTAEITASGGYSGTKGLRMGGVWPSSLLWQMVPDITVLPNFVLRYDFRCVPGAGDIINLSGFQTSYPLFPVMVQTTPIDCKIYHSGSPDFTDLPGKENLVAGNWYSVEVEHDYSTSAGRARFGPAGGTFYDWTVWVPMKANAQPTVFAMQGVNMEFDNIEIPGALPAAMIYGSVAQGDYVGNSTLVPVRVQLKQDGVVLKTVNALTFSFVGLPAGTYQVVISSGKSLTKVYTRTVTWGDSVDLGTTTLINGDLNGDNKVDSLDFNILSGNFDQVGD